MTTYAEFLADKVNFDTSIGFPTNPDDTNPILKPHQAAIVNWAVAGGRRAIFAAFGLGKSMMQLETLRLILKHSGAARALIVCPLGVRQEFAVDAAKLGIDLTFIRRSEDLTGAGIYITNYESGSHHPDVWHDVNRMLTLNTEQSRRAQIMHVCPLQFDIVDRLIERFTNPGDEIYDPFGGLGTVALRAIKAGRRGRCVELNTDYFLDGVKYLEAESQRISMPTLFDLVDSELLQDPTSAQTRAETGSAPAGSPVHRSSDSGLGDAQPVPSGADHA